MTQLPIDAQTYYRQPGPVTAVPTREPAIAALLANLPTTVPEIAKVVQGNILHIFWAERYGVTLSDARKAEVQIRPAATMLRRIQAMNPAPLTRARPHAGKLIGNCRDFTVLAVALMQLRGIPARARCGFGTYFRSDGVWHEDHWVAEYWNADLGRWIMVDTQMDDFQQRALQLDFDPLDVPHDRFVTGGHAWQKVRQNGADPANFGIFDLRGMGFVLGNVLRDFAALNNMPLLPWDCWGVMLEGDGGAGYSAETLALVDHVAALTRDNGQFETWRALYETEERLRVPPVITSFPHGPQPVSIVLADELALSDSA